MFISEGYREQLKQLHAGKKFGAKGDRWAEHVEKVALLRNSTSILDYGCGGGMLAKALPLPIREYDPAIPGKDAAPQPADIVVCTDVLEHIEPAFLDAVLDHLQELTLGVAFLTIHCGPASKSLPDGRNAHISQHPMPWWIDQINCRFVIAQLQILGPYTIWMLVRSFAEHERATAAGLEQMAGVMR